MNVTFKDGSVKKCSAPTEQKVFNGGEAKGWLLMFSIEGEVTSEEMDTLLSKENISELKFSGGDEENKQEYSILNYERVLAVAIRHSESVAKVEIQLRKGA